MQEPVAKCALLLALALVAPALLAQGHAPDVTSRVVAVEAVAKAKHDQEHQAVDAAKVAALAAATILPLFDFDHITRLAVARNWRLATPEQQRLLTEEFKTLLVRTYSNALIRYGSDIIDFEQLRAAPLGTELTVRSDMGRTGKERMVLDYAVERTSAGWKIHGVKIGGLCLVSAYREVFAEKVRNGGVDGLIKFLEDANRKSDSSTDSINNAFLEKSWAIYAILGHMLRTGRL